MECKGEQTDLKLETNRNGIVPIGGIHLLDHGACLHAELVGTVPVCVIIACRFAKGQAAQHLPDLVKVLGHGEKGL